jgi:hypothetical protein
MGINVENLKLLIRLREAGLIPDRAAVVEIGAQQLDNSFLRARSLVARLGQLFGVTDPIGLPDPLPTHLTEGGEDHLPEAAPLARKFWEWLGLGYASIDIDGSPGSIPLDLNYDGVSSAARGKYHVVTNFGTTEHVANQLNAFEIIHDLTASGGVMIHDLRAQGAINHGLVNYNPKFFWMLARSNDYGWYHFDYRSGSELYELPQNLVDYVAQYAPDIVTRRKGYRLVNASLVVVLQKRFDRSFFPPMDEAEQAQRWKVT